MADIQLLKRDFKSLRLRLEKNVLHLALSRPHVRNAFDAVAINELLEAFSWCGRSKDTASARVVIVSGEGPAFCAGADLNYMKSMAGFTLEENKKDALNLFEMFQQVRECALPVVAHVHGNVMGGGVGIAACADIVLAETGTQFRFSEVRLGIIPAVISPFVLLKMNPGWAKRWMMTGESFEAEQALSAGLVQFVGSAEDVIKQRDKIIRNLGDSGPEAIRRTKELCRQVEEIRNPGATWSIVTEAIAERRVSVEGQEGISAFLEKRNPSWRAH